LALYKNHLLSQTTTYKESPINFLGSYTKKGVARKMRINYSTFGMEMPGRKWQGTSDKYRYSHNSHEREDAIFEGAQSAEYWMYDSRIGRRWERDPVVKPWESPYAAFSNNPIVFADPKGLDAESRAHKKANKIGGEVRKIGDGKYEVVEVKSKEITNADGSKGCEVDMTFHQFKDNIFDKIGHAIGRAGHSLDNWVNSFKGGAMRGREGEGNEWVKSFKMGINIGYSFGGHTSKTQFGIYSTEENNAGVFTSVEKSVAIKTNPKKGMLATITGADFTITGFISISSENDFSGNEESKVSIKPYTAGKLKAAVNGVGVSVTSELSPTSPNSPKITVGFEGGIGFNSSVSGETGVKATVTIKSGTYKLD
jgi:hypothetical protein